MTYRHYIQVYLIILHKYSNDSFYWPSLSIKIYKENQTCSWENVHADACMREKMGLRYIAPTQREDTLQRWRFGTCLRS